jgi:hypothetical protein
VSVNDWAARAIEQEQKKIEADRYKAMGYTKVTNKNNQILYDTEELMGDESEEEFGGPRITVNPRLKSNLKCHHSQRRASENGARQHTLLEDLDFERNIPGIEEGLCEGNIRFNISRQNSPKTIKQNELYEARKSIKQNEYLEAKKSQAQTQKLHGKQDQILGALLAGNSHVLENLVKDHYEKKGKMDRARTEKDLKFHFERILTSTNPSDIKELISKGLTGSKGPTRDLLNPNLEDPDQQSPIPEDPDQKSEFKSMVYKISDLFNRNLNHVENNKNMAKNYPDIKTIASIKTVLSRTVKTTVAKIKHRDNRAARKIDLLGRDERIKTTRAEKEEGINLVIKNWLLTILKAQWTKIIWKIKILWAIEGLVLASHQQRQRHVLLTFNVIKIQRYFKKRILWRMLVNPGRLSLVIVKGGLSMYAAAVQQKVVRSNIYKLVRYFPRFVSVLRISYLIGEYVQRQTSAIYRMREHMSNMKVNGHEFAKNFDKAVLNLIQFEYDLKKEVPKGATFYNLSDNMDLLSFEMKNKLFWAIYNIRLLDYLKHHYYRKVNIVRRANAEDRG